jgi:hypothetical protein
LGHGVLHQPRLLQRPAVLRVNEIDVPRRHALGAIGAGRAGDAAVAAHRDRLNQLVVRRQLDGQILRVERSALANYMSVAGQADVVFGACQSGRRGSRVDRAFAFFVGRDDDLGVGQQPDHFAVAVVGGAATRPGHPAANEGHLPRHRDDAGLVVVGGFGAGHLEPVAGFHGDAARHLPEREL